ncbi:MAG: hypothetical protein WC302_02620 [Candidatus Paceibacterota bacterium]
MFYRPLGEIKKVNNCFCSSSCAAKINNKERTKDNPVILCANPTCQKPLPLGRKSIYCSLSHRINKRKIPADKYKTLLISRIRDFYKLYERIPQKREMQGMYKTARILFGTWNNAIKATGLEPNPIMFAKKHIAKDGHRCDSMAEKIIDDYLYSNKISHKRSVPYPEDKSLTADFMIKNKLIEFFGLAGQLEKYDQLIKRKRMICKRHNIPLIEIYPKDVLPINHLTKILLEEK